MSDVWTPPEAPVEDAAPSPNPDAAVIRRRHAKHEATIKAMSWLFLVATGIAMMPSVTAMTQLFKYRPVYWAPSLVLMLALVAAVAWITRALRQLKPWARMVIGALAALGLLDFPVGTAFNGYLLYLLFSVQGNTVFSQSYQDVAAQTPGIAGRASLMVWLFAAVYAIVAVTSGMIPLPGAHY